MFIIRKRTFFRNLCRTSNEKESNGKGSSDGEERAAGSAGMSTVAGVDENIASRTAHKGEIGGKTGEMTHFNT